ncbi:MAG: YicC family protein [Sedimentisphaerales bacterium]|nr:YicC family protein [Sedimentisphaerales bacterium]
MINSMTGYGEAEGEVDGITYAVTVKAVNNRYLKVISKLPEVAAFLDEDIERLIRTSLSRGTVNYSLRLKDISGNSLFDIDEEALQVLVEKLGRIALPDGAKKSIDVTGLLTLPGILRPVQPDAEAAERMKRKVIEISIEALNRLKEMRAAEGAALEADLMKNCGEIEQSMQRVRSLGATVVQEYAKKLKKRVNDLLVRAELKLDEEALAREVAIYADRSDISEELARLGSHLQQFEQTCQSNSQAGRRLDFISQEMLREANTIASKSSNADISCAVVDIKCHVDRIKEQVQNVE